MDDVSFGYKGHSRPFHTVIRFINDLILLANIYVGLYRYQTVKVKEKQSGFKRSQILGTTAFLGGIKTQIRWVKALHI